MQKIYCDICKKEITNPGNTFEGQSGKVSFKVQATIITEPGVDAKKDLCLGCTIKAINRTAQKFLKRKYTKKVVVDAQSIQ